MSREIPFTERLIKQLRGTGKYVINTYGGSMQTTGVSDIVTHDKHNRFTLIEAKVGNNKPTRNQFNQGLLAMDNGNRFIVAYEDFNVFTFDNDDIKKYYIESDTDAFDLIETFNSHGQTVEVIRKVKGDES